MSSRPRGSAAIVRRIGRLRSLARSALLFERAWPALWPALGVAGVFVCAALLGLPALLPPWLHLLTLTAVLVLFAVVLSRGVRGLRRPDDAASNRRLETASGLRHRPLAALLDRPTGDDAAAEALWRAHIGRAAAQIGRLRVGWPHPGLAAIDRRALRGGLVVALVAALAVAGGEAPLRLAQAFRPDLPKPPPVPVAELQAWVTPPAYTGVAPLFLNPAGGTATVPTGSRLTVSLTGGPQDSAAPDLLLDGQATPFRALDATSFQAELQLRQGGRLVARRGGRVLAGWDLNVVADRPPLAAFPEPPGPAAERSAFARVRLPWRTEDDYGVVSLQAELRLRARPDAPALLVPIPLPGASTKAAHGVQMQDLTAHPWAGLEVVATLVARDAAAQQGFSAPATFVLPERVFQHPLARELMALRKLLSLDPDRNRAPVAARLMELAEPPAGYGGDSGTFLTLSATASLLGRDARLATEEMDDAQSRLWQLALKLEEGAAERTARALEAARQAAKDALDKALKDPSAEHTTEFDRKIAALEQAIREHVQALVEELRREQGDQPNDPNAPRLDSRDMEKLAEQARKDASEGRMQDAEKRMAELEKMLDQLRSARTAQNAQGQRDAQHRQRGREQMGALQDMVQRQGGLLDHAQGRNQADNPAEPPGAATPPPANPGDSATAQPQREGDRHVQQALRRALGELMQQFGDLTGEVPKGLGEADTAMRNSADALAKGDDPGAEAAGQRAIQALQKGGQEMSQAMAKQFGQPQAGQQGDQGQSQATVDGQDGQDDQSMNGRGTRRPGSRGIGSRDQQQNTRRDPLGRRLKEGSSGADESADAMVPDQMERQRTRAIQDELRRRGAERSRPQPELDYIDRLLKQF